MLWFLAGVSVVTVVAVGYALEGAGEQRQLVGMSGARALVSLLIILPLNLLIISRVAGLRPRTFAPWLPVPLASGLSAMLGVTVLTMTGVLDDASPFVALAVAGGVAVAIAGGIMIAFEPRARAEVRRLRRTSSPSPTGP